jgi:hypothetical protein
MIFLKSQELCVQVEILRHLAARCEFCEGREGRYRGYWGGGNGANFVDFKFETETEKLYNRIYLQM